MRRVLAVIGVAAVVALAGMTSADAAAPVGSTGHDVSYPQCSGSSTTVGALGGEFGIVGVTNGLPWSTNPCLASEYAWAAARPSGAALYANTANPAPHSSYYWPTSGTSDPALCRDATSTSDPGCAYDYGWHAAANALAVATSTLGSNVTSLPWWLDVETANSWNGSGSANAADLQGAVDELRGQGVPSVGLYSSAGAWSTITGGYNASTAASYQSAWASSFTPQYPLSQSPTWVAGLGSYSGATSTCASAAFTGPTPQLAQYADGSGVDADLVCGAAASPPPPAPQSVSVSLSPTSGVSKGGATKSATVTVGEQGATQSVQLSATSSPQGPVPTLSATTLAGPGTVTLRMTNGGVRAGTYTITVTATGATSGSASATYTLTIRK